MREAVSLTTVRQLSTKANKKQAFMNFIRYAMRHPSSGGLSGLGHVPTECLCPGSSPGGSA
eukprot:8688906-Pyramimonas_sp.AAC.2